VSVNLTELYAGGLPGLGHGMKVWGSDWFIQPTSCQPQYDISCLPTSMEDKEAEWPIGQTGSFDLCQGSRDLSQEVEGNEQLSIRSTLLMQHPQPFNSIHLPEFSLKVLLALPLQPQLHNSNLSQGRSRINGFDCLGFIS
jgi:hypothetical protein